MSQYDAPRSHVSEDDGRRRYSSTAKQRAGSAITVDQDNWETSTQVTKTSIRDRVGSFLGKRSEKISSAKQERSPRPSSTPSAPRLPNWESNDEQRRRRFSRADDRLNRRVPRLGALKEEQQDGSIVDLEPGEVRRLMPPSSTEQWVNRLPLTEQAVSTFNARPQLGRMRAQSEMPVSSCRMISQERVPHSVAPGESAFSTIEPYDRASPRPERNRAQSAAPTYHTTSFSSHSNTPSYKTIDPQMIIHGAGVKSSEEEEDDNLSVAIQNSLREVGLRQPTGDSTTAKCDSPSAVQARKEEDELTVAIQESMRDVAVTARGNRKAVEKRNSHSDVQGWDEDELDTAIRQSTRDMGMSQRSDNNTFGENNSFLASQKREQELAARRKRETEDAVRRLEAANDAARRERDAEDASRRQRDAEDAARRKREADDAARQHDGRMRQLDYESELRKQEITVQTQQAEHAAKLRDIELDARSHQLAITAQAREAESARKLRAEEMKLQNRIAEDERRLAEKRSQHEYEKRKTENERALQRHKEDLASRKYEDESAVRTHGFTSVADTMPPPYSPWSDEGTTSAPAAELVTYSQPSQSTNAVMQPINPMPQVIFMPPATVPQAVSVQSQVTFTQPMSSPLPVPNEPITQLMLGHTTRNSGSSREIYRPPRRMGNIMPDSITRMQQHYKFRRSLIERNVQEGRRTSEQGRAAIACLNRNEVADIDSEPRRRQELNVIGLEAFEADIELLDRLGGDQMAPPVPWAIPSLEAESRGNYNHADLREHIEMLLAQQNTNMTASSHMGAVDLGRPNTHRGGSSPCGFLPGGSAYHYEWYEEYRF
jgi:hypothetical protein